MNEPRETPEPTAHPAPDESATPEAGPATRGVVTETPPPPGPVGPPALHIVLKGAAKALQRVRDQLLDAGTNPALTLASETPRLTKSEMEERELENEERRRQRLDIQLLEEQIDDLAGQVTALAQRLRPSRSGSRP